MNISTLPANPCKQATKRRLGRGIGSGRGKTSTRGEKGSGARSGFSKRPGFEGGRTPLIRRLPKRGFIQKATGRPLPFQVINVRDLERCPEGELIDAPKLAALGLIDRPNQRVKLLGDGKLGKAVQLKVDAVSESARLKVEKAGGKVLLADAKQPNEV